MIVALDTVLGSSASAACNHPLAECRFAFKIPPGKLYNVCESLLTVSDRTRAFWQLFYTYPQSIGGVCTVCQWFSISSGSNSRIDFLPHNFEGKLALLPRCDLRPARVNRPIGYEILAVRRLMITIDLCLRKVGLIKDIRRLITDRVLDRWKADLISAIDEYHSIN